MPAEPQPQEHDVGAIVRELSRTYIGTVGGDGKNLATPKNLLSLTDELNRLTLAIEQRDKDRRTTLGIEAGCDQLCMDVKRWRARLSGYQLAAANALPTGDRKLVADAWSALLLGWYPDDPAKLKALFPVDGPDGVGPLPPGFNPNLQHGADIATPFSVGNQLGVSEQFEAKLWQEFIADLKERATTAAGSGGAVLKLAAVGAGAVVAWKVAGWFRR